MWAVSAGTELLQLPATLNPLSKWRNSWGTTVPEVLLGRVTRARSSQPDANYSPDYDDGPPPEAIGTIPCTPCWPDLATSSPRS